MSEGHDWSQPPFAKKVYYWPFGKTFFVLVGAFFVLSVLTITYTHGPDVRGWHMRDWVLIAVFSLGASLLLTFIFYRFATVVLTPETICTMNDLSVRQTMRLDGIEKVSRPWYGCGLILILKEKGVLCRLWVPLFLQNMGDFTGSLARVVPPDNPLRAYFEGKR